MNFEAFRQSVKSLSFGKRLPDAVYIVRSATADIPPELFNTIRRGEVAANPGSDWNLLKLHTDQFALTFLTYPQFDEDPHPALAEAIKINLKTGSIVRTDYRSRPNRPILHRKETFLAPTDSRKTIFSELTLQEEKAGLYRDPSRIGLRTFWNSLLKKTGYYYEGHQLKRVERPEVEYTEDHELIEVQRHRTAIKRYDLSKPVKQLLERGLLRNGDSFFDYGCGHGMDIEGLKNLGYTASGWDPAFRPEAPKLKAEVVNLGYVLNVIEEPSERITALREAFSLTQRVLLVSTMVTGQETESHSRPYRDGFLTKTNTFQKFYAPGELETFIETTLDVEASTIGLGWCIVFANENDAELFESNRNRRRIDWDEIGAQLRFSSPSYRESSSATRYELNKELFDSFWQTLLELGRAPEPGEFDRLNDIRRAAGGINRAVTLVVKHNSEELWKIAREKRVEDVLVYLALAKFRKRFLRREIPPRIKHDVRSFFGDVSSAQSKAHELLFAAGDPDEVELACEKVSVGWQDVDSLTIHKSLLSQLPPLLRIFVHCAAFRYGDPEQADLIKIHKRSGKITFQHYDDFNGKNLPELQTRIKINLRNLFVEVFDHTGRPKVQLLYFKERFIPKKYPGRRKMEKFSENLRRLGLDEKTIGFGPDKESFLRLVEEKPDFLT